MSYRYDSMGRVEKVSEYYSGSSTKSTTYTYDGKGRVYQVANGTSTEYYAYDMFDRLDETYTYHGDQLVLRKNVGYEMVDERKTSHRLISWAYTALGGYINTYNFDYDQNGNITEIRDKNFDTSYEYDSANQLIRENNQRAGKTWTWEYDEAGNITCKKEYEYTTAEELVTALDEITYLYGNESWGDLLTSYDGRTITYDTIGNPLSDGIWDYTWEQGRRLTRMQSSSATWNYTYDTSGLRTGRTNGTTTYRYWYNDSGLLLRMEKGGTVYSFTYDPAGRPVSVTEGNTRYYYVLNQQGDVIGLLNSNAEMIVMYVYDAWGRVLASVDISASGIGTNNPLRYRGYVYDTETGLYYLQSRYYNPTWGRFISADNVLPDVGGNVQEYNLFVYCWNNPVNYSDQNGNWPSWITKVIIGAAVITAAAILTVATAGTGTTLACFAVGALKGATVGAAMGAFSGAATGAITHRITTGSWEGAGRAALEGAADGFMSGAITGFITGGLTSDVCFVAGTSVLASTGYVAIETVKAGDYVWASNPETGEVALKQVVRSFVNEATELIHVTVKGEEIVCSGGCGIHYYRPHKVWPP